MAQYKFEKLPYKTTKKHFIYFYIIVFAIDAMLHQKKSLTVLHIWQMIPLHLFHSFHMDLPPSWLFRNRFLELVLHLLNTHTMFFTYTEHTDEV